MTDVRQRNVQKPDEGPVPAKVPTSAPNPAATAKKEDDGDGFSFLEVARTCVLLLVALSAVSWFVTKESFTFNLERPNFTRLDVIKTWIVYSPFLPLITID
jgi:hypothetical protein